MASVVRGRSAVVALAKSVRVYFAENGITANVRVGFKERRRQDNQGPGQANRVIFVPATLTGAAGSLEGVVRSGPRRVPGAPDVDVRDLAIWNGPVVASCWAYDAEHPTDEEAQIEVVETLVEDTIQAIHYFGFGNVAGGDVAFTPPTERSFGLEMLFTFKLRRPFRDRPRELAFPEPSVLRGNE